MNQENKQVATRPPNKVKTLQDWLSGDKIKDAVAKSLPKHLSADRFLRIAMTAITRTPKLAECDQASFFDKLLTLSQLGIEPDGRRAHLIPFKNTKRNCVECQLIIDYKGYAELAMRSGVVSTLHADLICENDIFEYNLGEVVKHTIDFRKPRGKAFAVYSYCLFKDGCRKFEVMSREDVEDIRARSKSANDGPWATDWAEMAKKTVFRRLTKWLPLSPEIRDATEAEDTEESRFQASKPVFAQVEDSKPMFGAVPDNEPTKEDLDADGDSQAADNSNEELNPAATKQAQSKGKTHEPAKQPEGAQNARDGVRDALEAQGVTFDEFRGLLSTEGDLKDADSFADWDSIPLAIYDKFAKDAKKLAKCIRIYGKATK